MRGGFPHSEIPGSKSVCRLPEAYRRLQRPSSPSAAKASTVCAYSLDHITPNSLELHYEQYLAIADLLRMRHTKICALTYNFAFLLKNRSAGPAGQSLEKPELNTRYHQAFNSGLSVPNSGGARRDRTADPLLAKQVLSQLSYGPLESGGSGWI